MKNGSAVQGSAIRILALCDVHGDYETMESIVRAEVSADIIILGGDLTTVGSPEEATAALRRVQSFGRPVFAVCGNMDPPPLEEVLEGQGVTINAKGVIIGSVGFCGVSAAPTSFLHTPYEISEEEITRRAEKGWIEIMSASTKVFVPHTPPRGTSVDKAFTGTHVGSTAVRSFIEKYQPDLAICGHIHEARGQTSIGRTKIINCGTAAGGYYGVIEIDSSVRLVNKP